jgi:molybdopterin/thiamine biosynthesis adenylyltransferase
METGRFYKQEIFKGLGPDGQTALATSSVLVPGVGATGGTQAQLLVRAGVGRVRLADFDAPELGNLQRQLLYNESDVKSGRSKADLAGEALRRMNSEVAVEALNVRLGPENVMDLIDGMDLIMDGLDNQEARYVLNDAAVKTGRPYIYVGAVGSAGAVMPIIPHRTPCLRCVFPNPAPAGTLPSCDTVGIIGPAAATASSIASGLALRILTGKGAPEPPRMISFDLWEGVFREVRFESGPNANCPCCGESRFEFLQGD